VPRPIHQIPNDPDDKPKTGPCARALPPPPPPTNNTGASVDDNVTTVQGMLAGTAGNAAAYTAVFAWWVNQVKPGGDWDYKHTLPKDDSLTSPYT